MVENKFSCLKELTKTIHIALPLSYISNETAGVTDILESWKRQYNQQLQGIVVSFKNISLTSRGGGIIVDKPCLHYEVKATFELFCPSIGSIVQGKINRISHDYIGCLVHNTINVTIKRFTSSLDGLSEFIALDRMILFKITCFGYHYNVIKVKGEITEECVDLMKELAPFNTQSDNFQDSSTSYFSTAELASSSPYSPAELTEATINNVKSEENSEECSESLIAPNYSFQTTNQGVFNIDHLADRTSNDGASTPQESDSPEEMNTDIEKHSVHKIFTTQSEEEMNIDTLSDYKPPKKIKHKDKKSKDKSFNTTESSKTSPHSKHNNESSSKKKSKKNKTLNDSSFDTVSDIEMFDGTKNSLSPKKNKSSKSQNTVKSNKFLASQQNAVNPIDIQSNNFSTDFSVKEEVPANSDYCSLSPRKKSKSKTLENHLNNNITNIDGEEMMNIFAAFEPDLEEQLKLKEISDSSIKKEPLEMTKKKKKRKRDSSDEDGPPTKKKKSKSEKGSSGKNKSKLKKGKSKKENKDKSKKHKDKKSKNKKKKTKKESISYKIKDKKKGIKSRDKKNKNKKSKIKDVP